MIGLTRTWPQNASVSPVRFTVSLKSLTSLFCLNNYTTLLWLGTIMKGAGVDVGVTTGITCLHTCCSMGRFPWVGMARTVI